MNLSACGMLALLVATPVLADPPGDLTRNMPMSNANAAPDNDGIGLLDNPQPPLGACVKTMERAFNMADPASPDRAYDARREMELARTAFQTGDEFACQQHATHALNDRS